MDEQRLKDDEYEKQYYGFSSTELINQFDDRVKHKIKYCIKQIENTILDDDNVYNKEDIKEQLQSLLSLYLTKSQGPIGKFEALARVVFQIKPNVLLESDSCYQRQYTSDELCELNQRVDELENKLLQENIFLQKLKQEKVKMEQIKPLYEATNKKLKTVPSLVKDHKELEKLDKLVETHKKYADYCFNDKSQPDQIANLNNAELACAFKTNG